MDHGNMDMNMTSSTDTSHMDMGGMHGNNYNGVNFYIYLSICLLHVCIYVYMYIYIYISLHNYVFLYMY
jgi:hypothetical protein